MAPVAQAPAGGDAAPVVECSDPVLFVCTYVATIVGLKASITDIFNRVPVGGHVAAVNYNFGHKAAPGFEYMLKAPGAPCRHTQGDGTCFNSALEPCIRIDMPGVPPDRCYKMKCFTTTGNVQIPGVCLPDLADGREVVRVWVEALALAGLEGLRVVDEGPIMLDYKCRLIVGAGWAVNMLALAHALAHTEGVLRPKPPGDDAKTSFKMVVDGHRTHVNIFPTGKINVLGAASIDAARRLRGVVLSAARQPGVVAPVLPPDLLVARSVETISDRVQDHQE